MATRTRAQRFSYCSLLPTGPIILWSKPIRRNVLHEMVRLWWNFGTLVRLLVLVSCHSGGLFHFGQLHRWFGQDKDDHMVLGNPIPQEAPPSAPSQCNDIVLLLGSMVKCQSQIFWSSSCHCGGRPQLIKCCLSLLSFSLYGSTGLVRKGGC